jgi:tetratricopeptide (TPR) repeat protein
MRSPSANPAAITERVRWLPRSFSRPYLHGQMPQGLRFRDGCATRRVLLCSTMQKLLLFALFAALTSTLVAQAPAENKGEPAKPAVPESKEPAKDPAKKPTEQPEAQDKSTAEFRAMPREYQLHVMESMKRFQARDYTGALTYIDRAEKMQLPTVWTLNVRGAVAIEMHRFEEGERYCNQALKIDPTFFPAKFNLCEIPFLQGRYPEARARWEEMLTNYPINASNKEDGTPELLAYRIFLCHVLEKNKVKAKEWLEKIPFPSRTPAYHYANAVWERDQGKMEKWQEWLEQAEFIWPEVKRASFTDVLIQLKWMNPPLGTAPPPEKK